VIAVVHFVLAQVPPDDGTRSIPDPHGRPRPSNTAGFVVAMGMLVAWLVIGWLLFRRARRRP
jgi:hypothetical protein